ncbi:hypothetical protein BBJ28_00023660 [Nothophytophthora sp. Chile5]|nr:hypothetical protein BBJ28_00023660 [Nothophytophthora sp. Chile5]
MRGFDAYFSCVLFVWYSAGNRGAVYFSSDIVDMAELEERKKFRHHPLTGIFHSLPGYYDPLHKLSACRVMVDGLYSDTDSLRSFVAMDITDSDDFVSLNRPTNVSRMYSDSKCISNVDLMPRPRRFSDSDADPFFEVNKNGSSPSNNTTNKVHEISDEDMDESTDSDVENDMAEVKLQAPRSLPISIATLSVTNKFDAPVGAGLPPRRTPHHKTRKSSAGSSGSTESDSSSPLRPFAAGNYERAELGKSAGCAELTDGFISTGKGIFRKIGYRSSLHERPSDKEKPKALSPVGPRVSRSMSEGDSDDDISNNYTQAAPRIPANPFVARRLNDGDELRIMAIHRTGRRESIAHVLKNESGSDSEDEYNHPKPYFIHEKAVTEQYELVGEDQLGDGSYAVVKPAIRRVNGKEVAIKQIHKRYLRTEDAKSAVGREIEIHLRLRHKHIVRLYEVYETPDFLYLVMAKATKGNLKALMERKRRLSEALAGKLSQQIVRAVLFLHESGVLHCDLKPDNLLLNDAKYPSQDAADANSPTLRRGSPPKSSLDPHADVKVCDYQVELCDFGLSVKVPDVRYYKLTGDVHKVPFTGVTGTPGYIAPELLLQQPYGKPVDMWAVGIIIFEMLTGYQPFYPPHACIEEEADFSDRVWKSISEDAKDLVKGLLVRDPTKRLTAAEALAHSWFESAMFAI